MGEVFLHKYLVSKNECGVAGSNEHLPVVRGKKGKSLPYVWIPKEAIKAVRHQLQFHCLKVGSHLPNLSVWGPNAWLACIMQLF